MEETWGWETALDSYYGGNAYTNVNSYTPPAALPEVTMPTMTVTPQVGPTIVSAQDFGLDPSWGSSGWTPPATASAVRPMTSDYSNFGGSNPFYDFGQSSLAGSGQGSNNTVPPPANSGYGSTPNQDLWDKGSTADRITMARDWKLSESEIGLMTATPPKTESSPWLSPQMIMNYGFIGTSILSIFLGYERDKDNRDAQEKALDPLRQADNQIAYNNRMAEAGFDRFGNPKDDGGSGGGGGGGGVDTSNMTNPFLS